MAIQLKYFSNQSENVSFKLCDDSTEAKVFEFTITRLYNKNVNF